MTRPDVSRYPRFTVVTAEGALYQPVYIHGQPMPQWR